MITPNPTRHRSPAWFSGVLLLLLACNGRRCGGPDDTGQDCAEADKHLYYADSDGDGYGDALEVTETCVAPAGTVTNGDDCDDADGARVDMVSRWADEDGDSYGTGEAVEVCEGEPGYVEQDGDCDDGDAAVYPGAVTVEGNDKDDDCDGVGDLTLPEGARTTQDADMRISGSDAESLGFAVLGLPDLSGDGLADLALGAPDSDGTGAAYVFYSPFDEDARASDADLKIVGNGEAVRAGASLAVGDLTGDGELDLVVGCADGAARDGGTSLYVVHGPLSAETTLAPSDVVYFLFGAGGDAVVAGAFISDDDDLDLVSWAFESDFLSGAKGPIRRSTEDTNDLYGEREFARTDGPSGLAFIGDATGDGLTDLLVGRPDHTEDDASFEVGAVSLYDDPLALRDDADSAGWVLGPTTDSLFGQTVAPAGDVDGDGLADFFVGAPGMSTDQGVVYLFHSADVLATPEGEIYEAADRAAFLEGESDGDLYGATLAGGSDLDGDGRGDLAVGAPGAEEGQGAVYVWYGPVRSADADEADLKISGEASGDQFGTALDLSQDLNGLGRLDLVVGAPGANDGDGAVYVFFMDGL